MTKKIVGIITAMLVLGACNKTPREFSVKVDAPEIGTQQVTVVYTTDDGNRESISLPAVNGKFEFTGSSVAPSVVEIFTSSKQLYAALIAQNGESMVLTASDSTFTVNGSERANLFVNYKAGTDTVGFPADVRRAIDIVYTEHSREQWPVFESPELVMGRDTVVTLDPEGVWIFTATVHERTSSVLDTIRARAKMSHEVRDVYVSTDTVNWKIYTRKDSATWLQAMLPDAPLKLNGILTSTPLLVEVDSAGVVQKVQRLE